MIDRQRSQILTAGLGLALVIAGCGNTPSQTKASTSTSTSAATPPSSVATTTTTTTPSPSVVTTTTVAGPGAVNVSPYPPGRQTITLAVNGTPRTAVLVVPADLAEPRPLVIAFHGHGGSGRNFDRKMNIEELWPEAIAVYPDGLVGHQGKTDPEGVKTGWQTTPGERGDEDLAFYDALLADLEARTPVDHDRIFLMGHSNGSAFVSLLLNVRGGPVAATANMSAQPGPYLRTDPPRSMFMSMGQNDPIVRYSNQVRSVPIAEQRIAADPSTARVDGFLRTETGRGGLELAVYDYPGGHEPPTEVPPLIVAFFQRHDLSDG